MRLIASPVFRAFPELDGFTDEQCTAYVALARGGGTARLLFQAARVVATAGTALLAVRACCAIPEIRAGTTTLAYIVPVAVGLVVAGSRHSSGVT
jgi:hypothetical protein